MPEQETQETSKPMSIREAMEAAVEEHSKASPKEQAGAAETATEKVEENETQASDQEQQAQETAEEGASGESSEEILTEEEVKALTPEQRKELNKILTPKFQQLAEKRKRYEEYEYLIDSLETKPAETIRALARAQGLELVDEAKQGKQEAQSVPEDDEIQALYQLFGDENKPLADALVKVLDKRTERLTAKRLKELQPHIDTIKAMELSSKQERVESAIENFNKTHPDWQKYEAKMFEIGQKFQPTQAMSAEEYMESLYQLATLSSQTGKRAAATIERITRNAQSTDNLAPAGPAPNKVNPIPDRPLSLKEAFDFAMKGQVRSE